MSAAQDGGPAFPYVTASEAVREITTHEGEHGMTLRDYFAAKAMAGVSQLIAEGKHQRAPSDPQAGADFIAVSCYRLADAMLKAREAAQ